MTIRAQQTESFNPEPGSTSSADARQILSEFAVVSSVNDAQNKVNNTSDGDKSALPTINKEAGNNSIEDLGDKLKSGDLDKNKLDKDAITKKLDAGKITRSIPVTEQDRTDAKEQLAKDISELVPEADRESMKQLQNAIVDGDMTKLQETLKGLSGDPEKLATMLKEINTRFDKLEAGGGLDISIDSSGDVLVYKENGNTAVSINPATGATTMRAVERQADGSVLLKPGEIINRDAGEELHSIADAGTRSLTGFHKPQNTVDSPKPPFPTRPSHLMTKPSWDEIKPKMPLPKSND